MTEDTRKTPKTDPLGLFSRYPFGFSFRADSGEFVDGLATMTDGKGNYWLLEDGKRVDVIAVEPWELL